MCVYERREESCNTGRKSEVEGRNEAVSEANLSDIEQVRIQSC